MKHLLTVKNIYFFSALGIFIYLMLRAIQVPPVHDEAATFMHYVQRNEWIPYKAHWDANNHILNSFLSSIVFKLFGQGTLFLRLPSLLFFPVFVLYTYKISGFVKSNIVKIGFLMGMLGAHNLMEYFGYSRGYGMSMALLMACVFYVLVYLQDFNLKKLFPFYLFAGLAVVANLTLVNTILILNALLLISFLKSKGSWWLKCIYVLFGMAPIVSAGLLSMDMKRLGLLYYGSDKGFWQVTVHSLVMLIYNHWQISIAIFFVVLTMLTVFFLLKNGKDKSTRWFILQTKWIMSSLFLGNIMATILLQKVLGVNYPEDRTAMYFYFLLVLFFCFSLDNLSSGRIKWLALIWIVMPIHFMFNINLTHSSYWWYEHLPNSFYREIEKRAGANPEQSSIGGYVLMDMIWAYYNHQMGGKLNDIQINDYPSFYYDYLILYDDNNNAYAKDYYNVLIESPVSHIRVLERREKVKLNLVAEYDVPDKMDNWDEYIGFYDSDTLKYSNLCFDIETNFKNKDHFFFGSFALRTDIEGEPYLRESQEMHMLRTEWKKGYNFHHRIYVQNLSAKTSKVVLYFWNPKRQQVYLQSNHVKIYTW